MLPQSDGYVRFGPTSSGWLARRAKSLAAPGAGGEPVMLAFLIGTSILNVFLGYALAVYLMRETNSEVRPLSHRADPKGKKEAAGLLDRDAPALAQQPAESAADSSGVTAQPQAEPAANASAADAESSPSPEVEAAASEEPSASGGQEMDQQLLAGIADFRNQLAKLRAETGSDEPKRRTTTT